MDRRANDAQEEIPAVSLDRRGFFRRSVGVGALAWAGATARPGSSASAEARKPAAGLAAEEARFWEAMEGGSVRCTLEPRECKIGNNERGFCGVRVNRGGTYYSLTYGRPCSIRKAPIEENFMHVLPGAQSLNVGTAGCNLQCQFCNTWHMSQARPEDTPNESLSPEQLVERAKTEGCPVICFTDNEPVVCFEYMVDTAKAARKAGIKTTCHTAGRIHADPIKELSSVLDAVNVDLKAVTNELYQKLTAVDLDSVLEALKVLCETDTHVEVASPLIPKYNDPDKFAQAAADYIVSAGGKSVPWLLMRYFPAYQMSKGIGTRLRAMEQTREIGHQAGLKHIYLCNIRTDEGQNVKCGKCGTACVTRTGGEVECTWKRPGACPKCSTKIPGVWR